MCTLQRSPLFLQTSTRFGIRDTIEGNQYNLTTRSRSLSVTNTKSPIIVWLRRDLRLTDNPSLHFATTEKRPIVLAYIHDDSDTAWQIGAASCWWLHHSLGALTASVEKASGHLCLLRGKTKNVLEALIKETGADTIAWNRRYEPAAIESDSNLKRHLLKKGIDVKSFAGNLCHEPWQVQRAGKHPYKVFTAYWRASLKTESLALTRSVKKLDQCISLPDHEKSLEELALLPTIAWAEAFPRNWQPGEAGAKKNLKTLLATTLSDYHTARDLPSVQGTSRLSPHLAFGEISPRYINATVRDALLKKKIADDDNTETFLREIGWREFAHHLIYHFPHTTDKPLDQRFEKFPWKKIKPETLSRWQQGDTGIPLVDAGMRQLWQTGWMHNRVRMVVGSLLVKNLGYHWREGAEWFWDTLVDADLASNSMGWQWVAGSGADAAPYFRVFNPVRQGERFDPEGTYVRTWVPEIAKLGKKRIHAPWTATEAELSEAGIVLGETYPEPIVELSGSRIAALERFEKIKQPK